jgi:hypothetical protein
MKSGHVNVTNVSLKGTGSCHMHNSPKHGICAICSTGKATTTTRIYTGSAALSLGRCIVSLMPKEFGSRPHRDELPNRKQGEYRVVRHLNPERGRSLCVPEGSSGGSVAASSWACPVCAAGSTPLIKSALTYFHKRVCAYNYFPRRGGA